MLLPTELDTAMSPYPFRATMTLVMRSGMLVPAARNVRPITSGGMATVSPATFAHQTIRYEYAAIQKIEPMNVIGKNFFPEIKHVDAWHLLHIPCGGPMEITLIVEEDNVNSGSYFTAIFPHGNRIVKTRSVSAIAQDVPSLGITQSATWRQSSIRITRL